MIRYKFMTNFSMTFFMSMPTMFQGFVTADSFKSMIESTLLVYDEATAVEALHFLKSNTPESAFVIFGSDISCEAEYLLRLVLTKVSRKNCVVQVTCSSSASQHFDFERLSLLLDDR